MAAEFTRFSETILTKQDQRVVSITVKPMISDCTGRIYFTDLMVQEGDRLTGYVINTETILQKYREDGSIVPPRFYNGVVRSAETVVLFNLGSDTAGGGWLSGRVNPTTAAGEKGAPPPFRGG